MSSLLSRVVRFVAVAEAASFTKAAERLCVDQPWLSKQIHQLEMDIGFPLFDRTKRRLQLTESGAEFLVSAKALSVAADEVQAETRRIQRKRGSLRLGVIAYSFWVPARNALIEEFKRSNPSVTLEVVSDPIPTMLRLLDDGQLDAVILSHPPLDTSRYEYLPLHLAKGGILIPKDDPIASLPEVCMRDLEGRILAVAPTYAAPTFYVDYLAAGMIPRTIPEGRVAMSYYAELEGLCVLTWDRQGPEIPVPETMVHRVVVDAPPVVAYGLVRRRGDLRYLVERLWTIAVSCSTLQS